jgi:sugar lactone lactonase YvrE
MKSPHHFFSVQRSLSWSALASLAFAAQFAMAAGDIPFKADQTYPESVSWSAKQHVFIVSSLKHGQIGKVTMDGKYTPFISDNTLISSVGILVDDKRNTLWVANADPGVGDRTAPATQGKLAAVAAYDATTGKRRGYYDFGHLIEGAHFANDMTLDAKGNVYVTDSFSPVIYRIDTSGKTSIFAQSDLFKGEGFNLNGIAWHKDGYLLVGKSNSGELFRVSLKDPTAIAQVKLPEALKGMDGILLEDAGHLIAVQNLGADRTLELVSTDGWKTATVKREQKSAMSMPTAATRVGKSIYVLNSRIDTLINKDAPKVSDYVLQKF